MKNTRSQELDKLIKMAINGHYPLFKNEWLIEASNGLGYITSLEKKAARDIAKRIFNKSTIKTKMTILAEANYEVRNAFVKLFLRNVEHRLKYKGQELH